MNVMRRPTIAILMLLVKIHSETSAVYVIMGLKEMDSDVQVLHSILPLNCLNSPLNNCHLNASCSDNIGGFDCSCNSGFYGNGTSCYGIML